MSTIIFILIQLTGIVGAIRENLCLLYSFVLMILVLGILLVLKELNKNYQNKSSSSFNIHVANFLWSGINIMVALQFLFTLKMKQNEQRRQLGQKQQQYIENNNMNNI